MDGQHEPIIDRALFDHVQQMFATHEKRPKNKMAQVANPLAGLVVCAQCGRMMQYKGDKTRRNGLLVCVTQHCPTAGTYIDVVEGVVLDGLRAWVDAYEAKGDAPAPAPSADACASNAARTQLTDQLATLQQQSARLYDLLEQGVYSIATYRERRTDLDARLADFQSALAALDAPPRPDPIAQILPPGPHRPRLLRPHRNSSRKECPPPHRHRPHHLHQNPTLPTQQRPYRSFKPDPVPPRHAGRNIESLIVVSVVAWYL